MMSEENNSEWIDRYLSGQLDENAKGLLEEKLNTDEEFRMEVELQRSLKQQLRLYNRMELKKSWRTYLYLKVLLTQVHMLLTPMTNTWLTLMWKTGGCGGLPLQY